MARSLTTPSDETEGRRGRVPAAALTQVHDLIFGPGRTAGPTVALSTGIAHNTLWSFLNRNGLPAVEAQVLADDLCRRAAAMIEAATTLRGAAKAAVQEQKRRDARLQAKGAA
jgi:hypothetical protein